MAHSLYDLATRAGRALLRRQWTLTTAESCTGGWIAKVLTDVPGSSEWFERGVVTYSNQAKMDMLDVKEATLAAHGAVSAETVAEMARGGLARSRAQVAVAVSGVAGPDGGTPDKPVGTVWMAWAWPERNSRTHCWTFGGDRESVRRQAVIAALEGLLAVADES